MVWRDSSQSTTRVLFIYSPEDVVQAGSGYKSKRTFSSHVGDTSALRRHPTSSVFLFSSLLVLSRSLFFQ